MDRTLATTTWDVEELLRRVEHTIREAVECDEPLLRKMVGELVAAGGKRLRPRITLLTFVALGGRDATHVVNAAAAGELIHTATLIHDDIIDQSPLRRGRPTLHTHYGVPHAIVAGDFMFTKGFALSAHLPKELIVVTANACVRLAEGEVMEQRLLAHEVDEAAYLEIISKKTAEPMRAAAKVGAVLAGASMEKVEALGLYGFELGLAFQIADDILDVAGDPSETGKVVGQDAKTGVLTLPAGIGADGRSFRDTARELEPAELRRLAEESGAIQRARDRAQLYADRAKSRLAVLPDSPEKAALMALADDAVRRRK